MVWEHIKGSTYLMLLALETKVGFVEKGAFEVELEGKDT